ETTEIEPILNRLDIKKELKELEELAEQMNKKEQKTEPVAKTESEAAPEQIAIDEFFKTQLLVGQVEACEKIEKSKKLLKLTVFDGTRRRTIVSGIANAYTPEELVGRKVALVANLKPAKLCGVTSEGMLLCSVGEDGLPRLIAPEGKAGDKIC
ncbi:MAG: methionine--tRNA ligase subunit beta, partial [Clostridiales bacterium]|nr:methionine--tRNA ligase subunit beta [Clostridiales bacterium]